MESDFQFNTRIVGEVLMIDLIGDMTKNAEHRLLGYREWGQGLGGNCKILVLNFSNVPYINSAGIAILIRLSRTGIKAGFTTFACGVSPHYQKLFRMVGLTEYMMIYPNEHAVLQRIEDLQGKVDP